VRLLLDAIPLLSLVTGIGRYLRNLYEHIEAEEGIEINYFDGKTTAAQMPRPMDSNTWIKVTEAAWKIPGPATMLLRSLCWLRYEARLSRALRSGDYELHHSTALTPSAVKDKKVKQVFTLHDLSLEHHRDKHPLERRMFWDVFAKRRMQHADHIMTPSQFVRDEFCDTFAYDPDRVSVVPEAADPFFSPRMQSEVSEMLEKFALPKDYLLFVGTLEPRKNVEALIQAFAHMQNEMHLVLAGWRGWGEKPWLKTLEEAGLTDRVHIFGYVSDEDLARLYSGATAFVYPSRYEGFGLPLLEAMACGCPVVSSNAACLPETAGSAAKYFHPDDAEELAHALDSIVEDDKLRSDMSAAGKARAAEFTWKRSARETRDVFEKALTS
jgi:alpha-1,3-rhamnosyl/mannosyltransferase